MHPKLKNVFISSKSWIVDVYLQISNKGSCKLNNKTYQIFIACWQYIGCSEKGEILLEKKSTYLTARKKMREDGQI